MIGTYYYFKLRNGVEYDIKVLAFPVNMDLGLNQRLYRELTTEQREFYLANPTARVQEVVNCELNPPYVPPAQDLQEYIEQKVKELKDVCCGSVTITSLQYAMAEDKSNHITADSYYSLAEANQILSDFRAESKKAMTVLSTYKPRIEAAQSVEAVDAIYDEAIGKL